MKRTEKNKYPEIKNFLRFCSERVEQRLKAVFQEREDHGGLMKAIRYACLGDGKKIRPALVYAVARAIGVPAEKVDAAACAVELMHVYSLIHDDLPAMDDDELRRGRPTLHRAYGEAVAILAGDAMQTMAFEMLASSEALDDGCRIKTIKLLAAVAGTAGMAGGQTLDVVLTEGAADIETVETIHRLKTGSLMSACIRMPLACGYVQDASVQSALESYANRIGLLFQIRDDILDLHSDVADQRQLTYPSVLGLEATELELQRGAEQCIEDLKTLGEAAQTLRLLTRYIAAHEG